MSQPAGADRLEVTVVAETSGFAAGLQQKLDAQTAGVKAKIKAEISSRSLRRDLQDSAATAAAGVSVKVPVALDTRGLKTQLAAAAKELSASTTVRLQTELVTRGLKTQTAAAAKEASGAVTVRLQAELNTRGLKTQAEAAAKEASGAKVKMQANADTARAEAEIDAVAGRKRTAKIDVKTGNLSSVGRALTSLSLIPAIAGGIGVAVSLVGNLAEGLFSVAAAASQAVGIVGGLAPAILAAAQVVGTLLAGFGGIGAAVTAMTAAQTTGARQAATAAREQVAAQRRVADAQRAVAKARQQQDRDAAQGAQDVADARSRLAQVVIEAGRRLQDAQRGVAQAERGVADAQDQERQSLADLAQAREEARRQLRDLRLELKGAALDEESAQLAVDEAAKRLREVLSSNDATGLDRREADLAYRQALQRLEEVKQRNGDLRESAEKAAKAGVEGSTQVTQASAKVASAKQAEQDATDRLRQAQQDLANTQADNARDITKAQREIADAQVNAAQRNADAQQQVSDALRNLAEAEQDARATANRTTAAQTALAAAIANLSPAGQRFARFLKNTLIPAWHEVRFAVQEALLPPIQEGIRQALPLLDVIKTGLVGTATVIGQRTRSILQDLASAEHKADLTDIMASNNRALADFGAASQSALDIFLALAHAAGPILERFAHDVRQAADRLARVTEQADKNGRLGKFFDDAYNRAKQLWRIIANLGGALAGVFRAALPAGGSLLAVFERITKRWSDWAQSPKGQKALAAGFQAAIPVVEAVGKVIGDILVLLANLVSGGAGGGLTTLLAGLDGIVRGLNSFVSTPGGAKAANVFLTIAGAAGAIGIVSGFLTSILGKLQKIGKLAGTISRVVSTGKAVDAATAGAGAAGVPVVPGRRGARAASRAGGTLGAAAGQAAGAGAGVAARAATAGGGAAAGGELIGAVEAAGAVGEGAAAGAGGTGGGVLAAAGPVGLIIAAIIALGIGLGLAYAKVKWFHDGVNRVFSAVGEVFSRVYQGAIRPAFTAIEEATDYLWTQALRPVFTEMAAFWREVIAPTLVWLYQNVVKPVFALVGGAIRDFWQNDAAPVLGAFWHLIKSVVIPVFQLLGWAIKTEAQGQIVPALQAISWLLRNVLGPAFLWLWHWVVQPMAIGMVASIAGMWKWGIHPIFVLLASGINGLAGQFDWLARVVPKAWAGMSNGLKAGWDWMTKFVFGPLGRWLQSIPGGFADAARSVGKAWGAFQDAVTGPVKWFVDVVYNNGIRPVWNAVTGLVGGKQLGPINFDTRRGDTKTKSSTTTHGGNASAGTKIVGFAKGGVFVPGYAPGRDTVPAPWLSPGEGVLVPEAVRGIARAVGLAPHRAIDWLNSQFTSRVAGPQRGWLGPRFAGGGLFSWLGRQAEHGAQWTSDALGSAAGAVQHIAVGALRAGADAAFAPLRALVSRALPETMPLTSMLAHGALRMMDGALNFFGNADSGPASTPGPSGPVSTAGARALGQTMAAAAGWTGQQWAALERLWTGESGWNPLAKNPTSTAFGIPQFLKGTAKAYGLAYGDTNAAHQIAAGLRYIRDAYGNPAHALSLWLSRSPHWYDQGGWMQPGLNFTANGTGQPEAVLTSRQWDTVEGLVEQHGDTGLSAAVRRLVELVQAGRFGNEINVHPHRGQSPAEIAAEMDFRLAWGV